jgi:DNA-directed RNA polymerase specialized sigma24 family protein
VEGLTHGEIADILEIAEGTSKAALFEAKRQVRAALRTDAAPQVKRVIP